MHVPRVFHKLVEFRPMLVNLSFIEYSVKNYEQIKLDSTLGRKQKTVIAVTETQQEL